MPRAPIDGADAATAEEVSPVDRELLAGNKDLQRFMSLRWVLQSRLLTLQMHVEMCGADALF